MRVNAGINIALLLSHNKDRRIYIDSLKKSLSITIPWTPRLDTLVKAKNHSQRKSQSLITRNTKFTEKNPFFQKSGIVTRLL